MQDCDEENQKGQPGAPEAVLEPSRLEGQLDDYQLMRIMLQDRGGTVNI
jgi:hypothetical protein